MKSGAHKGVRGNDSRSFRLNQMTRHGTRRPFCVTPCHCLEQAKVLLGGLSLHVNSCAHGKTHRLNQSGEAANFMSQGSIAAILGNGRMQSLIEGPLHIIGIGRLQLLRGPQKLLHELRAQALGRQAGRPLALG